MKSKEFISALRLIIREEVTKAVRSEVSRVLSEGTQQPVVSHQPIQPKLRMNSKTQKFKNEILQSLLETTEPIQKGGAPVGFEEWPTMQYNGASFMGHNTPGIINAAPDGMNIDQIEQVAPDVAQALTKDYSSLMKAIDKKRGIK